MEVCHGTVLLFLLFEVESSLSVFVFADGDRLNRRRTQTRHASKQMTNITKLMSNNFIGTFHSLSGNPLWWAISGTGLFQSSRKNFEPLGFKLQRVPTTENKGAKIVLGTPHKLTWSVVIDGWHSQISGVALSMFTEEGIP